VIAGRGTQAQPLDLQANHIIYKDIAIESQLLKAISAAFGEPVGVSLEP
jgi:hypothetical protein